MLEHVFRGAAILASAFVVVGFVAFAGDEIRNASDQQLAIAAGVSPDRATEIVREQQHSKAREHVEDVNDVLLRPFAPLTEASASHWVRRGVPSLLALLVYGFGIAYAARFAKGRGRPMHAAHVSSPAWSTHSVPPPSSGSASKKS